MKVYRVRICTLPVQTQEGVMAGHAAVAYVVARSRRGVWSVLKSLRPEWAQAQTTIEQEYPTDTPLWITEAGPMKVPFAALVRAKTRRQVKRKLLLYWSEWPNIVRWIEDGAWKCVGQLDLSKPGVY